MAEDKKWFIMFVVADWLTDPELSLCKPSTRGIWIDAVCGMFIQEGCGQLVGTIADLARLCRCAPNEMRAAIDDLKLRNAADVSHDKVTGLVTLINRRMRREWTDRKSARERKMRERQRKKRGVDPPDVTPPVTGGVTAGIKNENHIHTQSPPRVRGESREGACRPPSPLPLQRKRSKRRRGPIAKSDVPDEQFDELLADARKSVNGAT